MLVLVSQQWPGHRVAWRDEFDAMNNLISNPCVSYPLLVELLPCRRGAVHSHVLGHEVLAAAAAAADDGPVTWRHSAPRAQPPRRPFLSAHHRFSPMTAILSANLILAKVSSTVQTGLQILCVGGPSVGSGGLHSGSYWRWRRARPVDSRIRRCVIWPPYSQHTMDLEVGSRHGRCCTLMVHCAPSHGVIWY